MWCEEGFLMFTRSKAAIFESLADLLRAQGYTPEVIASLKPKVTTEIGHRITETKQEMIIRPGKLQRPRIPPHLASRIANRSGARPGFRPAGESCV